MRKQVCEDTYCAVAIKAMDCKQQPKQHTCIGVVGDPCAKAPRGTECEGLDLVIVVDVTTRPPTLDHASAGDTPVSSQADVERLGAIAP